MASRTATCAGVRPRSTAGALLAFLAISLLSVAIASAAGVPLYENPRAPLEARVSDLLARLTPAEKVSLMAGGGLFSTAAIPRLGIPSIRFSDGTNGIRSNSGGTATVFPSESAVAATWDPAIARAEGAAIGEEARDRGIQVMLGPDVNIQRLPVGGRDFEMYSEDPYLAGVMGAAYVEGVQSEGVGATMKHFVGNEQELDRMRSSSNIDARALHEIYLAPFHRILKEANPWAVMLSYNRLNGTYMTEDRALVEGLLEEQWGYKGLVMSDWGAVHSTVAAANSGLDLEMPGPPSYFGPRLDAAVQNWQVEESQIDEAARRVLRVVILSGALDGKLHSSDAHPTVRDRDTPRARQVALEAASESIILLENRNELLPLDFSRIHSLAVIGPDANVPLYEGGGSAHVNLDRFETPLQGIRRLVGSRVKILYARGVDNDPTPPAADPRLLSPTRARTEEGLAFAYYANPDLSGRPAQTGVERNFDQTLMGNGLGHMSLRWQGFLWPKQSGTYQFSLDQLGSGRLFLDGKELIGPNAGQVISTAAVFGAQERGATVQLQAGRAYKVRIEYVSALFPFHYIHFGVRPPAPSFDKAVQAAEGADAAVVFVGDSRESESEGADRSGLDLYGRQNELVRAVLAANPNTVVVLENGAPLELPWAEQVPAIVEGWLNGEEGPQAMARVLFGEVDPSGKLPMSFPMRMRDTPAFDYYPDARDENYGEGIFVGYRFYDKRSIEPLFPFGYGLSYTTFRYSDLRAPAEVPMGQSFEVSLDVTNTGKRSGEETVELYLSDDATTTVVRPLKELKGFEKVPLQPGQTRTVKFTIQPGDLSYYDVHQAEWVSTPGPHGILVGASSRDIRLRQTFRLEAPAQR